MNEFTCKIYQTGFFCLKFRDSGSFKACAAIVVFRVHYVMHIPDLGMTASYLPRRIPKPDDAGESID
ncbi:MAG TPA: hypothetical protein VKA31_02070 [Mariprofundaceae bacterium]|nr:hypothetical protein [Mariprofundaceae bacterium]